MSGGWLLIGLSLCLVACGDEDDDDPPAMNTAGAAGDSSVDDCPDPNNPGVHYLTRDFSQCPIVEELVCDVDQYGFHNACGCGCIDEGTVLCNLDPDTVTFISQDPADCLGVRPVCEIGEVPFNNACGCGCRPE